MIQLIDWIKGAVWSATNDPLKALLFVVIVILIQEWVQDHNDHFELNILTCESILGDYDVFLPRTACIELVEAMR